MIKYLLVLSVLSGQMAAGATLTDANEILKKSEDVRRLNNAQAEVVLSTLSSNGKEDKKAFTYTRKLSDDKERFKTFTRFSEPAAIRNQTILFLEKADFESDVFLYLPTFKKVRRVESHSQSSSFMGSAFSYSDIATPLAKDYINKLIKSEPCPVDGGTCYLIESLPKNPEVQERTSYERNTAWINQETFMPVQWEFYQNKSLRKRMNARQIKSVDKGKYFPFELSIEDLSNQKKTTLTFSALETNKEIPDSTFTQQNMAKER